MCFQPGAAKYGNFVNYYSFNPPGERLRYIPEDLLSRCTHNNSREALLLDIGCNSGDLTVALHKHLSRQAPEQSIIRLLGIDKDHQLIHRAKTHSNTNTTFEALDIMEDSSLVLLDDFLRENGKTKFDMTFCFSITMWIHLNFGDAGLRTFLKTIANLSKYVIMEPQTWKCYRSAARRLRKLHQGDFDRFKNLEWKYNVGERITDYFHTNCNTEIVQELGETHWDRKIILYKSSAS